MGLRHVAGHGQKQGDGVLCRGYCVARRGIDNSDTPAGSCLQVDVVHSYARTANDLESLCCLDDLGGNLGLAAKYQALVLAYNLKQLLGAESFGHIHLGLAFQQVHPLRCYGFRYQYTRHDFYLLAVGASLKPTLGNAHDRASNTSCMSSSLT